MERSLSKFYLNRGETSVCVLNLGVSSVVTKAYNYIIVLSCCQIKLYLYLFQVQHVFRVDSFSLVTNFNNFLRFGVRKFVTNFLRTFILMFRLFSETKSAK